MKTTITVLFYLKRAKANAQGLVPIFQRITINGKRIDTSTGKFIDASKWSVEGSKMKGTSAEARIINGHLDDLRAKVSEIQKTLLLNDNEITFENFRNKWNGVEEKKRFIVPFFKEHNTKIKKLVGQEYAPLTLERYITTLRHLESFLQWKYNLSDYPIEKINYAFITDFDFYLRSERKCCNNTTVKYIKNFGKIVKECISNGWLTVDPFFNYKAKVVEVKRDFLNEDEIQALINKVFTIERLELVRDLFVFSCFTGLAYVDVKNLTQSNISIGIDGDKWIFTSRQKTDIDSRIPLLPVAEMILEKYKDHPCCVNKGVLLPVMTNQKMNSYLKEIADVCGIDKNLTFHIARHTFATTVTLTNGVPIESVSKMLGHTNIKTTQHYAKILDKKVSEDMKVLREKFAIVTQETKRKI